MEKTKVLIFAFLLTTEYLFCQCMPQIAESCSDAFVFCSLSDMDGYACSNESGAIAPCICGGASDNTNWWAFTSEGGLVQLIFRLGNCQTDEGLAFGIFEDCPCNGVVVCEGHPKLPNTSYNAFAHLKACKTYYFFVDGLHGNVCDFTINTLGGNPPTLAPIGFINNKSNSIIEPVCKGVCDFKLFVNPQPGGCEPKYIWTLDGNEIGGSFNEIVWDFPDEGDFEICVTAIIGNLQSGSICRQSTPRCAIVKVANLADKVAAQPTVLCYESVRAGGYKWHSNFIYSSGIYKQNFTQTNCCKFDSLREFIVLDPPLAEEVTYLTCTDEPFIDLLGRAWKPCTQKLRIPLPGSSLPYKCDSLISLTAVRVDYNADIRIKTIGDTLEFNPDIVILNPCESGEVYEFNYAWYEKNDPMKTLLSTEERYRPQKPGDYMLQVKVTCKLGTESLDCNKIFEEKFDEFSFLDKPALLAEKWVCPGDEKWLHASSWISDPELTYIWSIQYSTLISNPDSSSVLVRWNIPANQMGKVSVKLKYKNFESNAQECEILTPAVQFAGSDEIINGRKFRLKAQPAIFGKWTLISGPATLHFSDSTQPDSEIEVSRRGVYCLEWKGGQNNCFEIDTVCLTFQGFVSKDDPQTTDTLKTDTFNLKSQIKFLYSTKKDPKIVEVIQSEQHFTFHFLAKNTYPEIYNFEIFDLNGRLVRWDKNIQISGESFVARVPSNPGVYILKLSGKDFYHVQKILIF